MPEVEMQSWGRVIIQIMRILGPNVKFMKAEGPRGHNRVEFSLFNEFNVNCFLLLLAMFIIQQHLFSV